MNMDSKIDFIKEELSLKKYYVGKGILDETSTIVKELKRKKHYEDVDENLLTTHVLCLLAQGLFRPKILKVVENTRYPLDERRKKRPSSSDGKEKKRERSRSPSVSRINDLIKAEVAKYASDYPSLKIKVMLRADSHGRGLEKKLECLGMDVDCVFQPGARINEVLRLIGNESLSVDVIVILGGTNDTWNSRLTAKECVNRMNLSWFKESKVKVLFVEIFKRFGARGGVRVNERIDEINSLIVSELAANRLVKCMNNEWMSIEHYRKDYVHLNDGGKNELCVRIRNLLRKWMMDR